MSYHDDAPGWLIDVYILAGIIIGLPYILYWFVKEKLWPK